MNRVKSQYKIVMLFGRISSPPPPPINRGGGGTPSTQEVVLTSPKGCPLFLPLFRSNLHSLKVLLLPPLYSGGSELWTAEPCRTFHTVRVDTP